MVSGLQEPGADMGSVRRLVGRFGNKDGQNRCYQVDRIERPIPGHSSANDFPVSNAIVGCIRLITNILNWQCQGWRIPAIPQLTGPELSDELHRGQEVEERRVGVYLEESEFNPNVDCVDFLQVVALSKGSKHNAVDWIRTAHLGLVRDLCRNHDLHRSPTGTVIGVRDRLLVPPEAERATAEFQRGPREVLGKMERAIGALEECWDDRA